VSVYAVERLVVRAGRRAIIKDVGFTIGRGECVALVGASGSGKSQTCLAPFGLSPLIAEGSARLGGVELVGADAAALRTARARQVGFVFQQPMTALTPHLKVGAQLAEAWRQAGASRPARRDLTALLDRVGLTRADERLDQYPHRLSGGERQRVMIAAAVAHRPALLVADEPTSALDAELRHAILALFDRLRADGLALLLVTHDLGEVPTHADRVVVLNEGRVVEQGAAATVLARPVTPYTRALIAASPRLSDAPPALPPVGEPLLEARGIAVSFARPGWRRGRLAAGDDVSRHIAAGEALALVGGSGSGKSTLGRAIARLGPVDRGAVLWKGVPLPPRARMRPAARRALQPVFPAPVARLVPLGRVADSIAEPLRHFAPELSAAERAARVAAVLDEVELGAGFADRRPAALSGGQAQRVALARSLVTDPALLLLDEATSALDVLVGARVLALLARLQRSRGLALLFITHDRALARRLCHRIAVLDAGRIVEEGETATVIAAPRHPVTQRLVAASAGVRPVSAPTG
jgi:peptide/nickel transport system ATP-binding protein